MTRFRFNDDEQDITEGLRALHAAPAGDAYWNDLEARIMSRVIEVDLGWWGELDRWARPAMLVAALLILAAGAAMFRAHQVETQAAYENLLTPSPVPVEAAIRPTLEGEREATLRDVFGSKGRR
jgi:hypothetical protein